MRERCGVHERGDFEVYCPRCGVPAGLDEVFCKKCGKQLPAKAIKPEERLNMFCRFCGNKLHDEAVFCSGCGKRVAEEHEVSQEATRSEPITKRSWAFPVTLLLFFVFSNIRGNTLSWVFTGIGLITVLILWLTKCIKAESITPDVLCIPIAVLLLEIFRNLGFGIVQHFSQQFLGQYGVMTSAFASASFPEIENTWGANSLWLWGMFVLFLLLRSDTVKIKKIHHVVVCAGLIIWSLALAFILSGQKLAMQQGLPAEVIEMFATAHTSYFIWMFLRRYIFFCFICLAGNKRLGIGGMLTFPISIIIGSVFLVSFAFSGLNLGMASVSVLSFGYLFGLIVLLVAFIKNVKRMTKGDGEYVLPKVR